MTGDLLFFLGGDNFDFAGGEAEKVEAGGNGVANGITVFADTAGEDEKVDSAEKGNICADCFAHGSGKDVEGEDGAGIVGLGALFECPYIALARGESVEAAAVIDQILECVGAEFFRSHKIEENAGIEIARARTHGNAAGWGEAHGGVNGDAIAESAEAGSVAEMSEDGAAGKLIAEVMDERFVG